MVGHGKAIVHNGPVTVYVSEGPRDNASYREEWKESLERGATPQYPILKLEPISGEGAKL